MKQPLPSSKNMNKKYFLVGYWKKGGIYLCSSVRICLHSSLIYVFTNCSGEELDRLILNKTNTFIFFHGWGFSRWCLWTRKLNINIDYTHSYFCFVLFLFVSWANADAFFTQYFCSFERSKQKIANSNRYEHNSLFGQTLICYGTTNYSLILLTNICCENFSFT